MRSGPDFRRLRYIPACQASRVRSRCGAGEAQLAAAAELHARPLCGSPGGDQVETSDARWFTVGDMPALPIRPAMRLRIGHALTPAAPVTSAETGHPAPGRTAATSCATTFAATTSRTPTCSPSVGGTCLGTDACSLGTGGGSGAPSPSRATCSPATGEQSASIVGCPATAPPGRPPGRPAGRPPTPAAPTCGAAFAVASPGATPGPGAVNAPPAGPLGRPGRRADGSLPRARLAAYRPCGLIWPDQPRAFGGPTRGIRIRSGHTCPVPRHPQGGRAR